MVTGILLGNWKQPYSVWLHTSYLLIYVITTWQCSASLCWRYSGASNGCFLELKMNGTRLLGPVFNSQKLLGIEKFSQTKFCQCFHTFQSLIQIFS